jgi:hypothetical protein
VDAELGVVEGMLVLRISEKPQIPSAPNLPSIFPGLFQMKDDTELLKLQSIQTSEVCD